MFLALQMTGCFQQRPHHYVYYFTAFLFTVYVPSVCSAPLWLCSVVLNGPCLFARNGNMKMVMKEDEEKEKQAIVSMVSNTVTAVTPGERR